MEEWACSISSASARLRTEEMWPSNRRRETEIWTMESDHKKHREPRRRGRREGSTGCSVCGPETSEFVAGWERERVLPGPGEGWDKVWRKREVCTIKGMFAFACVGKRATEALFYVEHKQANTGMFGPLWGDYCAICKYIERPTQQCTAFVEQHWTFPSVRGFFETLACRLFGMSRCHVVRHFVDSANCRWQFSTSKAVHKWWLLYMRQGVTSVDEF